MSLSNHIINNAILGALTAPGGSLSPSSEAALIAAGVRLKDSNYIEGRTYGILPDTGVDYTTALQTALTACRLANKPLRLAPGKYIYSGLVNNAGGGLVCTDGIAWLDNQDPTYSNLRIQFKHPDNATYLVGLTVSGIKFTCSTRPDSGLTNNAQEPAGFLAFERCKNVKVVNNEFTHSWGGAVLFRWVEDSIITLNLATDLWKDVFHITGGSRNIIRSYNIVRGCGDDAFPVVGYITHGVKPVGILDIGNRVYGVRMARAFAYVGASDCTNIGCYVDGRIPVEIPQRTSATGDRYNGSCALYIAAESSFNSYGSENITVQGLVAEYIAPGISSTGTLLSTLQAIHISAGNGASNLIKNIKVEATLRNISSRALFCVGNGFLQDVEANIILEDNTDPAGLTSLTNTPNSGLTSSYAAEFQNTRNFKLKLKANAVARGAVFMDAPCSGTADLDISVGSVCQTTATQNLITLTSGSALDAIDYKINFEVVPPATGIGSINRIVDNGTNQGVTRSVRVTGVNCGTGAPNKLTGWPVRTLTLGASPSTILNPTGRQMFVSTVQGTVTSVARTGIVGRVVATVVTTGANGTVTVPNNLTDLYTAAKVVTLFDSKGISLGTATVASSAYTAGTTNTTAITFDTVNAAFAPGMQLGIQNTQKVLTGRTSGIFDLPPETTLTITYTAAPTATTISDSSY